MPCPGADTVDDVAAEDRLPCATIAAILGEPTKAMPLSASTDAGPLAPYAAAAGRLAADLRDDAKGLKSDCPHLGKFVQRLTEFVVCIGSMLAASSTAASGSGW